MKKTIVCSILIVAVAAVGWLLVKAKRGERADVSGQADVNNFSSHDVQPTNKAAIVASGLPTPSSPARERSLSENAKLEALDFKYRAKVYATFAKRGSFTPSPVGTRAVLLEVPPDVEKAEELRKEYWLEMAEIFGAERVATILKDPGGVMRVEDGLHFFGARPVTFQFDVEELDSTSPSGSKTKVTSVRIAEIGEGSFGGGRLMVDKFKKIYGDVANVVLQEIDRIGLK